jgi:hypothetical protein
MVEIHIIVLLGFVVAIVILLFWKGRAETKVTEADIRATKYLKERDHQADEHQTELAKVRAELAQIKQREVDLVKQEQRFHVMKMELGEQADRQRRADSQTRAIEERAQRTLLELEEKQRQQYSVGEVFELRERVKELESSLADFEADLEDRNQQVYQKQQKLIQQANELAKIKGADTQNQVYQSYLQKIKDKRQQRTKEQRLADQLIEIRSYERSRIADRERAQFGTVQTVHEDGTPFFQDPDDTLDVNDLAPY